MGGAGCRMMQSGVSETRGDTEAIMRALPDAATAFLLGLLLSPFEDFLADVRDLSNMAET